MSFLLLSSVVRAELFPQDLNFIGTGFNSVQALQSSAISSLSSLINYVSSIKSLLSSVDSNIDDIESAVSSFKSPLNNINSYMSSFSSSLSSLGSINTKLGYIESNVSSYLPLFSTESTLQSVLSAVQAIDFDGLATESTLQSVLSAVQAISTDGLATEQTLLDFYSLASENYGWFVEYLTEIDERVGNLATDETLQSVLSAVQAISTDGLATQETLLDFYSLASENYGWFVEYLTEIDERVGNLATESTLQSVLTAVQSLADSSYDDDKWVDYRSSFSDEVDEWHDWREKFWTDSFSSFLGSSADMYYADINFATNSVPRNEYLEYSSLDFFSASLKFISDGNKINAATTRFLKHIYEKMPKEHDTSSDENRITGEIDEASGKLDSLKQTFDDFSEIAFKEDVEDYFDSSVVLKNFQDVDLPAAINITIPSFGNFGAQVLSIQTSSLEGFLNVSRSVFACLYFVILAGFILFAFKLFVPVLSKFSSLLATVLNW